MIKLMNWKWNFDSNLKLSYPKIFWKRFMMRIREEIKKFIEVYLTGDAS